MNRQTEQVAAIRRIAQGAGDLAAGVAAFAAIEAAADRARVGAGHNGQETDRLRQDVAELLAGVGLRDLFSQRVLSLDAHELIARAGTFVERWTVRLTAGGAA
jgi:hypothetical protein